jgi:two-component system OmpR family response regulator
MVGPADRPILVVDDDPKIVHLVRTYLEREGHRVVEATDGRTALESIERDDPLLVILDVMLPEIDGLAVLRAARRRTATPVIVLSARGTTADRIAGLSVGADDYIGKPFSPAELVLRVERVLARSVGGGGAARAMLESGDVVVDTERREVSRAGRRIDLTPVEFRLLETLITADGRVLSRDQLLDAVYGTDADGVLDRTIDVHVGRLRDKLGDRADEPDVIATVRGFGYRAVHGRSDPSTVRTT